MKKAWSVKVCEYYLCHYYQIERGELRISNEDDPLSNIERWMMFKDAFDKLSSYRQTLLREAYMYNSSDLTDREMKIVVAPEAITELANTHKRSKERIWADINKALLKMVNWLEAEEQK